jgi:protein-disulfide isomerase
MRSLTTIAILLLLACSSPAQQSASGQSGQAGSDVAAQIGDRTITVQELDDHWRQTDPAARAQAVQQLYEGRKAALDGIIAEMLLEEAAEAEGTNSDAYLQGEIARRLAPLTEAEVMAFFQENQDQMQGRGFAVMGPIIRRFLEENQRESARLAIIADLRAAGPPLRMVLDAPRYDVPVAADDPALGSADAAVTLVEFSDFQCPFCARVMPTLKQVREQYGDRVRIVWKDFPLTSIHPQAFKAAEAGHCAFEQGKFWEYHDQLFANQNALEPEFLKKYAADTGLDAEAFNACLDTAKYGDRVQEQMALGTRLGVSSTPSAFINGRMVTGAQPYEVFTAIIDEELARAGR